jgi:hypothetical protein
MEIKDNPIIQERTLDTLAHTHDILTFLQAFFSSNDFPSTAYERSVHLGIFWILDCTQQALMFEMERLKG